ncbi:MAG: hypothetical protein HQM13_12755 [SAR324 cluster bacterium]|nr:hypothetical protein [SAR324 cluster bacterium]
MNWIGILLTDSISGPLQWYLYGSGSLSLLGFILLFQKKEIPESLRLKAQKMELQEKKDLIVQQEKQLKEDLAVLEKRVLHFNQRLKTYHEWMEFPTEVDSSENFEEERQLNAKDREVAQLLKNQTESFFDHIKNRKYYRKGEFQGSLLWEDILDLIESIARIYNPDSEHPLLQTDIEKLLRAVNQFSINLIVLLDRLPMNIKDRTLKETYGFIQKGVKGFEFYERAVPYLEYAQPLYYFGRVVLGTNPVTMGASMLATEIGKTGTKQLAIHFSEKYALRLLHETIGILANESASLFGGDYRHREANWIYGAELTELVYQFPISQEILQSALNEIGNLQLRSEYDRLFLYRCLTAHQSAHPEKYPNAFHNLSDQERQNLAKGLEKFYARFIFGRTEKRVKSWSTKVEDRLGCKLHLDKQEITPDEPSLIINGLFSLASFLVGIKDREISEIENFLSKTLLMNSLKPQEKQETLKAILNEAPMIFSFPEFDPKSNSLSIYLKDLIALNVTIFPHDQRGDQTVLEVIQYFRLDQKEYLKSIQQNFIEYFEKQLIPSSAERKVKYQIARPLLAFLQPEEQPRFIYRELSITPNSLGSPVLASLKKHELLMLGTNQRLLLLALPSQFSQSMEDSKLLWSVNRHTVWGSKEQRGNAIHFQSIKKRLVDNCQLKGGEWNETIIPSVQTPQAIVISGTIMGRYDRYFAPLLDFSWK